MDFSGVLTAIQTVLTDNTATFVAIGGTILGITVGWRIVKRFAR